jgi:hypothetical protein
MGLIRHFIALLIVLLVCGCCDVKPDKETNQVAGDAMASNNPGLCENLNLSFRKHQCYEQVASGLRNSTICNAITDPSTLDKCKYTVGIQANSFSACLEISDDQMKALCIAEVAGNRADSLASGAGETWDKINSLFTGQTSPCESLGDSTKRDNCYRYAAVNTNRSSNCGSITDRDKRVDCYAVVAYSRNNEGACHEQENAADRDKCLYTIAFATDKPSYCFNIESSFFKEKCYRRAGVNITIIDGQVYYL